MKTLVIVFLLLFRQKSPPGLRLVCAYLINEFVSTCVMGHKREACTATTELLTRLNWFTLPRFKLSTFLSASLQHFVFPLANWIT